MIMLRQSGRGFKAEKKVISKRFIQPSILPRACQWIHVHAPKQCANAQMRKRANAQTRKRANAQTRKRANSYVSPRRGCVESKDQRPGSFAPSPLLLVNCGQLHDTHPSTNHTQVKVINT